MISNPTGQNSTFPFYGKLTLSNMFFVPNGKKLLKFPTNGYSVILPHFNPDRRHFDPGKIRIFNGTKKELFFIFLNNKYCISTSNSEVIFMIFHEIFQNWRKNQGVLHKVCKTFFPVIA